MQSTPSFPPLPQNPSGRSSSSHSEDVTHDVYLLGLSEKARAVAEEATRRAFPRSHALTITELSEVKPRERKKCLVVLGNADAAATLITATGGAPRCAVVVLGGDSSDLADTVPADEWNSPLLARVFRSAVLEQDLVRENARLRGDLKTVARRISHDLRTPVGCIYTTSDIFKELPAGDTESAASMAAIIKESAGEISAIVDRVSFVLRASADPIAPTRVDMGGIVTSTLHLLDHDLQKANAKVQVPSSWPEVLGVTSWLQAVWSNLIKNAFQHGGPAAHIEITWKAENDRLQFSVADRGRGVTEARVAGLFSQFDQLHSQHVPGLGLCLVERLVSLQGGRCGYKNNPTGGSIFSFCLPITRST